jgi:hypothetical protein
MSGVNPDLAGREKLVLGGIGVSRRPNPSPAIKIFRRGDLLLG